MKKEKLKDQIIDFYGLVPHVKRVVGPGCPGVHVTSFTYRDYEFQKEGKAPHGLINLISKSSGERFDSSKFTYEKVRQSHNDYLNERPNPFWLIVPWIGRNKWEEQEDKHQRVSESFMEFQRFLSESMPYTELTRDLAVKNDFGLTRKLLAEYYGGQVK